MIKYYKIWKTRLRPKNKDNMTTKRGKIAVAAQSNVDLSIEDIDMLNIRSDTEENEAECQNCGLIYGETEDEWICCSLCDTWLDLKCANISKTNILEEHYCSDCLHRGTFVAYSIIMYP